MLQDGLSSPLAAETPKGSACSGDIFILLFREEIWWVQSVLPANPNQKGR